MTTVHVFISTHHLQINPKLYKARYLLTKRKSCALISANKKSDDEGE